MGCCGGEKVDAINYYSERVQELQEKIAVARSHISTSKKTNYGWISYDKVAWAHANAKHLASSSSPLLSLPKRISEGVKVKPTIELAPQPKDIIWSNLSMNEHIKRSKRLIASVLFYAFVFLWFIPSSFLSASNNVKDVLRLFPNGTAFIKQHPTFVSLLSSWFTPIIMAIFFFILPKILRFMSQQQGYITGTSLDRQVLAKLYVFFIINNLLVFTVSSTLMGVYSEIQQAVQNGTTLTAQEFFSTMGSNLTQVAKNMSGKYLFLNDDGERKCANKQFVYRCVNILGKLCIFEGARCGCGFSSNCHALHHHTQVYIHTACCFFFQQTNIVFSK